ncbi:hypothetical protein [Bifidobacterium sp. UTBIF-68]|uniref:hypothetical protein n=1 Tax=Bifidobacterium sp. UTBIF-68 TaxID=1465262 RepID=UPI0015E49638|nr:hypothetical protein [Bifidobacterium sp. UTBIF-68]
MEPKHRQDTDKLAANVASGMMPTALLNSTTNHTEANTRQITFWRNSNDFDKMPAPVRIGEQLHQRATNLCQKNTQ